MDKTAPLLACTPLYSIAAHAHRVWVETAHTYGGKYSKAELGYGESPELEPIAENRLHIFNKPVQLITEKGKEDLAREGSYNYQYQSSKPAKDGSYLATAECRSTFWSKSKDDWKQVDMTKMPGATYCEQTRMYGKNIVNVGHESADTKVITRQISQALEIVPLNNPTNVNVGEPSKVRVLFNGEPLPNATVTATFDGFDTSDRSKTCKTEAQAFSDTTVADGTVDIIPLRQGFWKASIEYKTDYPDQKICQKQVDYATLTFQIGHSHH